MFDEPSGTAAQVETGRNAQNKIMHTKHSNHTYQMRIIDLGEKKMRIAKRQVIDEEIKEFLCFTAIWMSCFIQALVFFYSPGSAFSASAFFLFFKLSLAAAVCRDGGRDIALLS